VATYHYVTIGWGGWHAQSRRRWAWWRNAQSDVLRASGRATHLRLNGPHAVLLNRAFFQPVSMALQEHTRGLADFIVQTTAAAQECGYTLRNFHRENELRLTIDNEQMIPDCAFQLASDGRDAFNYLVEIDKSTEPVRLRRTATRFYSKA